MVPASGTAAPALAADVRHYAQWITASARASLAGVYETVGRDEDAATPAAWLWARMIQCPNPACGAWTPMVRSFTLSSRPGREARAIPVIDHEHNELRWEVGRGISDIAGTKQRARSRCLFCGTDNITDGVLRTQCRNHGIRRSLIAVVRKVSGGVDFLTAAEGPADVDSDAEWLEQPLPSNARWFSPPLYGLATYRDLFTGRQVSVLAEFARLIDHARHQIVADGADEPYANAVATYLGLAVSRLTDFSSSMTSWDHGNTNLRQVFSRQAIQMSWDYAETNLFEGVVSLVSAADWIASALEALPRSPTEAEVHQLDASQAMPVDGPPVAVSTDPPYYDNIGYSDLSDFFYIWIRRALRGLYPDLLSTLLTPKTQELVADPTRFDDNKAGARDFFEAKIGAAFERMRLAQDPRFPLTLYYAFKQTEAVSASDGGGVASTGWQTMLSGLLSAGFAITGTWPMRTEQQQRSVAVGTNALASSVVLVCRPRAADAPVATRREFRAALRAELPEPLRLLQSGSIAPVDLAQAAIGPGMAVFSRYTKVIEADGAPMTVRTALAMINEALDEIFSEQEGDFDPAHAFRGRLVRGGRNGARATSGEPTCSRARRTLPSEAWSARASCIRVPVK